MPDLRRYACALLLALGICGGAAAAPEIALTPIRVSGHVYYFLGESGAASAANKGNMSNAAFVVTADGVLLFDALGTPALARAMRDAIGKVTPLPIKRVIVSHYHADHVYGLQVFQDAGVEIWAHENGRSYIGSDAANARLAQRRTELAPWVDGNTRVVVADRWLHFGNGNIAFDFGGLRFQLIDASGAHSNEDIMLFAENDRVLLAGDLFFNGRIPYVGDADSKAWLAGLDRMFATHPAVVVPGHGAASSDPQASMQLTRDYLLFLRERMGAAVSDMSSFDDAYRATDWSRFKNYPAFDAANRANAYGTYLRMESESLHAQ